jgi:4-hydroxy-tetrahydrodipicolinate synthase
MTQVTMFHFGLVHAPLTPFTGGKIDLEIFEKALDFHIANGAEGLAIQTHTGESVSLPVTERKAILEFAIRKVEGRVPVVANVSEAGTGIAVDLAKHAKAAGAQALMASVPYYWTPPDSMLVQHFGEIGGAGLPLFLYNSPAEMAAMKIKTPVVLKLMEQLPNLAGVIDCSMDWQFMIEVVADGKRMRSDFQLISGTEYMISAHATGATGFLSPIANVAPALVRRLYDHVCAEKYRDALALQVDAAFLYRLFDKHGVAGLKAAAKFMGRDAGAVRPPLPTLDDGVVLAIEREMKTVPSLTHEKHGW